MKYSNIYTLFCERVEQYHGRDVFYIREGEEWTGISWERFNVEAHEFAYALAACSIERGASVCVLMGNVPEWAIADIGIIIAGGVSCGLYPTSSAEQCRFIINHSDAAFVLVDSPAQLEKILQVRDELPKLKMIIALDEAAAADAGVMSYREFLRIGREHRQGMHAEVEERALNAGADETVIMVYTSGTTGTPKGACLSHAYVINSVESLRETIPLNDADVMFSYLPYCHVAERIAGLYNRLYAGASAYFVDDARRLWDYFAEVKPTVFPSLPRFFEKVHAAFIADMEAASPEERERFDEVLNLGRRISRLRQAGASVPRSLQAEYDEKAPPIVSKLKSYFGGCLRLATSGGAPLPGEVAEFFDALGVPILQAYGLTENVCVAFNRPEDYRLGTVGQPMPGCEVKIADDGEILVRSSMMFSGYYKEPEKTAEIFRDGWLLTGDLGKMDADGFLQVTGRKKEIIVTSTGKNVAPAALENLFKEHHLISHAFVYGDNKIGDRTLGVLEVMNKDGGFVEDDKRLVTIFAAQAAHLLGGAQLFEQLRDSEERHRQIFESALDGLYRSTVDGRFVTLNPALWTMLGYADANELMQGNLVREVFADASTGSRILAQLEADGQVLDVECELRRKSGETLPARLSARVVTDPASGESYHLGIVRNVTEQKRLSEQLKISEQLAVVGELVAGVAHEVRNPLCGITTTLSAMARRLDDQEAVQPFIDVVLKEADHLNHLMEQLLEHSRPNRIESHRAGVRSLVVEVIRKRRAQFADKGVELELTCPANLPGLHLDCRKMHGVFANLLDNALQHTAPGGRVAVHISADNTAGDNRAGINIELSDTGSGVAPGDLSKIFEPFYTTRTTGTGLGLAIVRKAVHDHGGQITARSEPGKGTRFVISLPLANNHNADEQKQNPHY